MFIHEEINNFPSDGFSNLALQAKKQVSTKNYLYFVMYNNLYYRYWNTYTLASLKERKQILEIIFATATMYHGEVKDVLCIPFNDKTYVSFVGVENPTRSDYKNYIILKL